MVIRRFLERVIIVQRHFRVFLACKRARILLLTRLFDVCELQYINVSIVQQSCVQVCSSRAPLLASKPHSFDLFFPTMFLVILLFDV